MVPRSLCCPLFLLRTQLHLPPSTLIFPPLTAALLIGQIQVPSGVDWVPRGHVGEESRAFREPVRKEINKTKQKAWRPSEGMRGDGSSEAADRVHRAA